MFLPDASIREDCCDPFPKRTQNFFFPFVDRLYRGPQFHSTALDFVFNGRVSFSPQESCRLMTAAKEIPSNVLSGMSDYGTSHPQNPPGTAPFLYEGKMGSTTFRNKSNLSESKNGCIDKCLRGITSRKTGMATSPCFAHLAIYLRLIIDSGCCFSVNYAPCKDRPSHQCC